MVCQCECAPTCPLPSLYNVFHTLLVTNCNVFQTLLVTNCLSKHALLFFTLLFFPSPPPWWPPWWPPSPLAFSRFRMKFFLPWISRKYCRSSPPPQSPTSFAFTPTYYFLRPSAAFLVGPRQWTTIEDGLQISWRLIWWWECPKSHFTFSLKFQVQLKLLCCFSFILEAWRQQKPVC